MRFASGWSFQHPLRAVGSVLLVALLVGCVNLTKPPEVQKCAATNSCSDNPDARAGDEVARADGELPDQAQEKAAGSDLTDVVPGRDGGPELGAPDTFEAPAPDLPADLPSFETSDSRGPEIGPDLPGPDTMEAGKPDLVGGSEPLAEVGSADVPGPDVGSPDLGPDLPGPEAAGPSCTVFYGASPSGGTAGHPPTTNSTKAFCVVTCDTIVGWNCSNFDGRTVTVNGTQVKCGDPIPSGATTVFQVSAGTLSYATIYWWGTWATSCKP